MTVTAGIDVGSTYAKALLLADGREIVGRALARTGFRLPEVARRVYDRALAEAGIDEDEVSYVIATGFGRHQVPFRDVQVTDLTAGARAAACFFPHTRTVLDIGGQTMKASRIDGGGQVKSFRLNDKCAAGTGAFIEKTAQYMGYSTEEIGPLAATSKDPAPISGVCAVFAESEVINHLSLGRAPADIMQGAMNSLVGRAVQLMKRVRMEPEFTLLGGILRFPTLAEEVRRSLAESDGPGAPIEAGSRPCGAGGVKACPLPGELPADRERAGAPPAAAVSPGVDGETGAGAPAGAAVNVPPDDLVQYAGAFGAAYLGHRRLRTVDVVARSGREARGPSPALVP